MAIFKKYFNQISTLENSNSKIELLEKLIQHLASMKEIYFTKKGTSNIYVLVEEEIMGSIIIQQSTTDLEHLEQSDELDYYIFNFTNIIITNFYEFRLYHNGELIKQVKLESILKKDKSSLTNEITDLKNLLNGFLDSNTYQISNSKKLAIELAKRTKQLKIVATKQLSGKDSLLEKIYNGVNNYLLHDISREDFMNLYAQVITYGLFAARIKHNHKQGEFNSKQAYKLISQGIGILKDIFQYIFLEDQSLRIKSIIDDITQILLLANIEQIRKEFHKRGKNSLIIHFYETFLAEYDSDLKKKRGVYYTPQPIVDYIVESVHKLLKEYFGKEEGLADKSVTVLDPAAGTLTYIIKAFKIAIQEHIDKYGQGTKNNFIQKHLLNNFYAFELMMVPYAIGHLNIGFSLEEEGYILNEGERFNLYLTNTLEMEKMDKAELPILSSFSEESKAANEVKKEKSILAIVGNPPYHKLSANKGDWILDKIEDYKYVDGKYFNEQKHFLGDDYVKFIRFAQWKIEEAGEGIVGFITNNSFLSKPTFRGMRRNLMKAFDKIYILNLHGELNEKCPDGSKDENVFDITTGVAITILIKKDELSEKGIYYENLCDLRKSKYNYLQSNDINSTEWDEINPKSKLYSFVDRKYNYEEKYQEFISITDIFSLKVSGIATSRDKFITHFDKRTLKERISNFRNLSISDKKIIAKYSDILNHESKYFELKEARKDVAECENWEEKLKKIVYRPFDIRYIYYSSSLIYRPIKKMPHMLEDNTGILFTRTRGENPLFNAFITNYIVDQCSVGKKSAGAGISYVAPLYIYSKHKSKDMNLFAKDYGIESRRPNINQDFYQQLEQTYSQDITPKEILYYIYGIIYSKDYQQKYHEFLKNDYPKIPFTNNYNLFIEISNLGKKIADLHLMKSDKLNQPIVKYPKSGSDKLGKKKRVCRNYNKAEERVYINKEEQCFEGIPPEVWEYKIGGYQVLDKWLYYRRERKLTDNDKVEFCKIATALYHTIKLQDKIDKIYHKVEESLFKR